MTIEKTKLDNSVKKINFFDYESFLIEMGALAILITADPCSFMPLTQSGFTSCSANHWLNT